MAPSTTLGPVYCTINGEELEIKGFKNISLEPETTHEFFTLKKGESEMRNEVLDLYEKRERERIGKQFKAIKE